MSKHQRFSFQSKDELLEKAAALKIDLPYQDEIDPLFEPLTIDKKKVLNRLAVHPMEGFDGNADGSPSKLTFRRYRRYAEGGSGLIWFEATSINSAGRSNPRQLWLNKKNLDQYKRLVELTRKSAHKALGNSHDLFLVLQLTDSGRFSYPKKQPQPRVVVKNPFLDKPDQKIEILSDDDLEQLQEEYVEATRLTHEVGFDAVDVKACHGYLLSELLSSFERVNSRFGGVDFDNRVRFLTEVIDSIRSQIPGITITVRLNLHDGLPHPYGFGAPKDGSDGIDLSEPIALIDRLVEKGCTLINTSMGTSGYNSHIARPFDRPLTGANDPPEHPLKGVARLLGATASVQKEFPDLPMVGTGYSWLRQFFPNVGAAVLKRGQASVIGLGRSSFAYPDAARDLMETGHLDPKKLCVSCSGCTELMKHWLVSGCKTRDREIYGAEYRKIRGMLKS